ncbi:MAG: sulfite exporter TauE/SafE family protein [Thermodesulfovibrionales bacterium]
MIEGAYLLAFSTGLLGGFGHCIGMCGPVVAAQALRKPQAGRQVPYSQLLYNAGRITTYACIGGLMGLAGSFVNIAAGLAGIRNAVMVLAGLAMIYMGLAIAGMLPGIRVLEQRNAGVLRIAGRIQGMHSAARFFGLGLVLGLLPCGLSATAFLAAAATGNPVSGFLLMLCFGLGTVPALLSFGMLISSLGLRLRGWIYRSGGVLVVVMGILFVIRGIRSYGQM